MPYKNHGIAVLSSNNQAFIFDNVFIVILISMTSVQARRAVAG